MLAFQKVTPWHDKTFDGMERDPPPPKRRRLTTGRDSVFSVGSTLPYGWVSEQVVGADSSSSTSAPAYPTLLAQSYWSQPQDSWSAYRLDSPATSDTRTSQFGHTSSSLGGDRFNGYDVSDIEWHDFGGGDGSVSSFSEPVAPQLTVPAPRQESRFQPRVSQSATSSSWDIMTSGPGGPQYEYFDAFARQCQASQGSYAPFVEAPVLRSNLPMGSRTSMPPPAQPQPNPERARKVLEEFETHLENSFEHLQMEALSTAADELLAASRALLDNTRDLRLFHDKLDGSEPAPDWRRRRREIWRQFNACWLGVLTKQMDLSQRERSGYATQAPRSRISRTSLSMIGLQMRNFADKIKDLGLIDYEQGFNERRITEVFTVCVDLANELEGPLASWPESANSLGAGHRYYQFQGS